MWRAGNCRLDLGTIDVQRIVMHVHEQGMRPEIAKDLHGCGKGLWSGDYMVARAHATGLRCQVSPAVAEFTASTSTSDAR